jgi:hypothetical protein
MGQEEIEVVIGSDGEVVLETHGIKGAACMKVMEAFVKALGKTRSVEQTAEYYEAESAVDVETHLEQEVRR